MPSITEKYKKEVTKPSDVEAILEIMNNKNKNFLTEINYPYEMMALRRMAQELKKFDLTSGQMLEQAIEDFKEEMIPFKRKRVQEVLEAYKALLANRSSSPDDTEKKRSLFGN